jgi:hypothetical protein
MLATAACPRRFQTSAGALDDQLALELGETSEDCEDQTAVSSGGVDRRAFTSEHLEADAALRQVADRVDEVVQITPKPVEFPYNERIVAAQRLQAGVHARRFIAARELSDACSDRQVAGQMAELELVRSSIDANLDHLHTQCWAVQAGLLRQTLEDAPDAEKLAAKRALDDRYDTRGQPETSRAALMQNAIATIAARKHL